MTSSWRAVVEAAAAQATDEQVETARRALDYLCLTQIYLRDNVLLDRPLLPDDIEETPAGHWGTCPPANAVLAALGPIRQHLAGIETLVVHGAGHAAASARAHAWLTGTLGREDNALGQHPNGLRRLVAGFPRRDRFGGEITPLLPEVWYMGGQLGPALPVAHGMALDAPHRLVVALVGDGEFETGTAAAAWLGERALEHSGSHGRVLPVLMLNGLRMGSPSLLASLTLVELRLFFAGLGYRAIITEDSGTTAVRTAIRDGLAGLRPLECGPSAVVVVTVPKGWGAPEMVGGRRIARTPAVHKTPLPDPRRNPSEFGALADWLASYRPGELFTSDAVPTPAVTRALGRTPAPHPRAPAAPRGCVAAADTVAKAVRASGSGDAITDVLRDLHDAHGLRVFCPDELASNHIHLDAGGHDRQWVVEVLNEELCHLWAQGYQETGRRALVVSYEAFAPHVASLLAQHLSYRRLAATAGRQPMPSITYLLTSLGWHNTVSHANPALVDMLIAAQDPSVHVYTPADAARAAAAVATAVRKLGRCNLIITSKHPMPDYPLDTVESELRDGYAVWPHLSDDGRPDLVLVSAGDIPARELTSAVYAVRRIRPSAALRYVHVHDLTCLGDPAVRPAAIPDQTFGELFPPDVPVLAAVPCHMAPVHALLAERGAADRFTVRGWRNPDRPLPPPKLLEHTGLDTADLTATALRLLGQQQRNSRSVTYMTSPDLSTLTADFDRLGYVTIPEAITAELRSRLGSVAETLLRSTITRGRDRGADGKDGFRGALALNPDAFLPVIANPRMLPVVAELLSPNIHILSTHLIALPSIAPEQPRSIRTPQCPGWHRDMFGVTADLGQANTPRMAIKCAYYLTDITPECGLTMFLPGSHLLTAPPQIPPGQIDPPGAITPALNGTDVVLFENRTWHAGGCNTSGRPRIALMVQYGYRWLAPVDDPAPELLERSDLTDVQRQLLGAADRNPDGSVAKGLGAKPIPEWPAQHPIVSHPAEPEHLRGQRALQP